MADPQVGEGGACPEPAVAERREVSRQERRRCAQALEKKRKKREGFKGWERLYLIFVRLSLTV